MSEDNQENGTANGDVPEIELIIKDEIKSVDMSDTDSNPPVMPVCPKDGSAPTNDQYIIFELKTDTEPMYNYVITQVKKPPPDDGDPSLKINANSVEGQTDGDHLNNPQYVISVQIPVEADKEEAKENSPKSRRATNRKKLAEALDAVVNKQFTISKAASVFHVTKSTLWKEVNKHTNHRRKKVDQELNQKIADRICAGESLSGISRSLKVAKSTLHQHKVRLAQSGQLPPNVTLKPPADPSERLAMKERILQAFRGCRVNGMSIRFAAKFYSIPPSTLWKHIRRFKASQQHKAGESTTHTGGDENADGIEDFSEDQSVRQEDADLVDFDVDAYCDQQEKTASEDGDFLISFDFETFEQYVKRELN